MRATLAVMQHDVDTIITQSRRALEYLHPDNLPVRTATTWTLGYAYQLQGDRAAASQAYTEIIATGKSFGDSIYTIAATINLDQLQEADNQLSLATRTYRRVLQLAGDPGQPTVYQIRIKGQLGRQWTDWFGGLTITLEDNGEMLLTGPVVDQAALHGVLRKVRDLGMPLLSVIRVKPGQAEAPDVKQ